MTNMIAIITIVTMLGVLSLSNGGSSFVPITFTLSV
jgi:hypothetical protein